MDKKCPYESLCTCPLGDACTCYTSFYDQPMCEDYYDVDDDLYTDEAYNPDERLSDYF